MKSKEMKKMEAEERNAAFSALTVEQKIAKIKAAPGASKRQLKKLQK